MQIVIDIDEETLQDLYDSRYVSSHIKDVFRSATPLPIGHGRMIDADAFIATMEDVSKRHKYKELLFDDYLTVDDVFKAVIESLQNEGLAEGDAPTIIEADRSEET